MGDSHKFVASLVLSYAILIVMIVFQFCYISNQNDMILKLNKRIIDLESPGKVDSIIKSYKEHQRNEDYWMYPESKD